MVLLRKDKLTAFLEIIKKVFDTASHSVLMHELSLLKIDRSILGVSAITQGQDSNVCF